MNKSQKNNKQQPRKKEDKVSYMDRVKHRQEIVAKPGAVAFEPVQSDLTHTFINLLQRFDPLYAEFNTKSGVMGVITSKQKDDLESRLVKIALDLDRASKDIVRALPGRRIYYTPERLQPFLQQSKPQQTHGNKKTQKTHQKEAATDQASKKPGLAAVKPAKKEPHQAQTAVKATAKPAAKVAAKPAVAKPAAKVVAAEAKVESV